MGTAGDPSLLWSGRLTRLTMVYAFIALPRTCWLRHKFQIWYAVQQIAKVFQEAPAEVENHNWFTTYKSFPLQHALPLSSNTVNQLWFSTVQLACCGSTAKSKKSNQKTDNSGHFVKFNARQLFPLYGSSPHARRCSQQFSLQFQLTSKRGSNLKYEFWYCSAVFTSSANWGDENQ